MTPRLVLLALTLQVAIIFWVVRSEGREHLIPAVPEIVREVDLGARRVVIRPPEGLLEL